MNDITMTDVEVRQFHSIVQDLLRARLHPAAWPDRTYTAALARRIVATKRRIAGAYQNGAVVEHAPIPEAFAPSLPPMAL